MGTATLNSYDFDRYDRQIMLFGEASQSRLKNAAVTVSGVGGLGCPTSLYLAAAGVGKIRLVDCDDVELSNLNRQVLHWDGDIGARKVESAYRKLKEVNPSITLEVVDEEITEDNVLRLVEDVDVIVDCLDNFDTRYVINRAAWKTGIPLVHGAIYGMEARVSTFVPGETCCFRCLYPHAPPKEKFPVIGAAPGLAAMIQVMEVVKLLSGTGELLKNRLLMFDGEISRCTEVTLRPDPDCPDCG